MKLSLSKWLKPASATTDELEEQLSKAEEQHSATIVATAAARESFDATGATSAENALVEAEDTERRASVHVDRARRLLAAARERDEAEHRRQLQSEAEALQAELADLRNRARSGPEVAGEIEALIAVVNARLDRWDLTHRIQERTRRLAKVNRQLGNEAPPLNLYEIDAPNAGPIHEAIGNMVRAMGNDPRRDLLRTVLPESEHYRLMASVSELENLPPLKAKT